MWSRLAFLLLICSAATAQPTTTVLLPGDVPLEMVWLDAGTFRMGALETEDFEDPPFPDEIPDHRVILSQGFWIGRFEVTQSQWETLMPNRPFEDLTSSHLGPDRPAVFISWVDAQEFVAALNESRGDSLFRLPTEAEWEYAARAGSTTRWHFGDTPGPLRNFGWYERNAWNAGQRWPHDVGQFPANAWGLHDMLGNAAEWVHDWFDADYYDESPERDPRGPERGSERTLRGGSFRDEADDVSSTARNSARPDIRSSLFGFRVVANGDLVTAVTPTSWGLLKNR